MKKIKFYHYTVENHQDAQDLGALLNKVSRLSIDLRLKTCNHTQLRLEELIPPRNDKPFYLAKFSRFRHDNWPGVGTREGPVQDLNLAEDALLSEETFLLYCPSRKLAIVQYNHFGASVRKIQEYLVQALAPEIGGYSFIPILNRDAAIQYQNRRLVTSMEVQIDGITSTDIAYFRGTGLEGAIQQALSADAGRFVFSVSVDARHRENTLKRPWIDTIVRKILSRNEEAAALRIKARERPEDSAELIDLLESRKRSEFNLENVPRTIGRRLESDAVYRLLELSYER